MYKNKTGVRRRRQKILLFQEMYSGKEKGQQNGIVRNKGNNQVSGLLQTIF